MNRKIRKCIRELENLVINDNNNKYIILDRINELKTILENSVIIPKKKLQFVFTTTNEKSPINSDEEIGYIKCEINTPKVVRSYIIDKYFRENEKYIIEFYKETLKNKLIDDWSMIEYE